MLRSRLGRLFPGMKVQTRELSTRPAVPRPVSADWPVGREGRLAVGLEYGV